MANTDDQSAQMPEDHIERVLRNISASDVPFERPDEQAIAAYLSGTATEEQRVAVRAALMASPAFRRELLDLYEEITRISDATPRARTEPTMVLSRVSSLSRYGVIFATAAVLVLVAVKFVNRPASVEELPLPIDGQSATIDSSSAEERDSATVARPMYAEVSLERVSDMNLAYFMGKSPRGAEGHRDTVYATAEDAARAAFSRVINYRDGVLVCLQATEETRPEATEAIYVAISDSGAITEPTVVQFGQEGSEPLIWCLTFEDRALHRAPAPDDSVRIVWPAPARDGAMVATFRTPDGYVAAQAICIGP